MPTNKKKVYVQFSKKLITAVMIFWFVVRLFSVVAVWLNPVSGDNIAKIIQGIDDIAVINVLAYTGNSVSEKIALGYFQMRSSLNSSNDDDAEEDTETEEVD